MSNRQNRINDARGWILTLNKDLSFVELRNLYKKRYGVSNICVYRDLAHLGYKEAKLKVFNYKENQKRKKQKREERKAQENLVEDDEFVFYEEFLLQGEIHYNHNDEDEELLEEDFRYFDDINYEEEFDDQDDKQINVNCDDLPF